MFGGQLSIQPRGLGLWLTGNWPLLGLHWQHMTSHRKPSTPARECLLGSTADRPRTMAGTCVRRPIRQLSIQPRELGLWLTGRWPLLGLHWQHTTSHRKPSTPARECLLGSTVDRPHTMAGTCVRRPIEYSTEGAWPLAHRQMATTWAALAAHDLPSQTLDPSP